ncbi:probable F-box protein At2g36090 [Henckelia pumila]|uniref:probable F-box protein At2g36090 n=1 Tax=Henckelia pumila TaxID=405737 RepID=UPI003C6DE39A
MDQTETVPVPLQIHGINGKTCMSLLKKHLKVSWIVIDSDNKRAVNIASHKAVCYWILQWNGGNTIRLRYSKVVVVSRGNLVQWAVLVTCSGEETGEVHVKEVKMYMEDRAGNILSGREEKEK